MEHKIRRSSIYLFLLAVLVLSVFALLEYPGRSYIYILFTIVSNILLYYGFARNFIFFDTFIGVFFWLGFWLKLTIRVAFLDGQFIESVGSFDGSGAAFDRALLVASCGMLGLIIARCARAKYLFTYPKELNENPETGLFQFYKKNRKLVLFSFVVLFVFVAVTNAYLGIYQRGSIPRTILPFGLGGIYKWLLLFGLASISALIIKYEFRLNNRTSYPVVILGLLENFMSNVSLLSRGMIINSGALGYGIFKYLKKGKIKSSVRFWAISFFVFFSLFISSVYLVNYLRSESFRELISESSLDEFAHSQFYSSFQEYSDANTNIILRMVMDRWIGIEGVMAVSSYPHLGWKLLENAWKEKFGYQNLSFYDENLIISPYRNTDLSEHHHISLPGSVAFFFYPGSYLFLFGSMFVLGIFSGLIEMTVFRLGGGNIILCSLLAMVVAFRYVHFGYAPKQSYLLFGALFLNVFIIYFADKILSYWYGRKVR